MELDERSANNNECKSCGGFHLDHFSFWKLARAFPRKWSFKVRRMIADDVPRVRIMEIGTSMVLHGYHVGESVLFIRTHLAVARQSSTIGLD